MRPPSPVETIKAKALEVLETIKNLETHDRWGSWVAALVALGVAGERLPALVRAPATDFDDAYMFLRYARNLIAGFGMRWNRGEPPVFGATSLPHVAVVALVRGASPRLSDAAVLQGASGAAAVLVAVALAVAFAGFAGPAGLRRRALG